MSVQTQRKEAGTTVDFAKAKKIEKFQKICYRNDQIGILAYQNMPKTINASIRDALLNGDINDIFSEIAGQGMQGQYAVISWNETAQGNNYYITDLRIGVVFTVVRDYNTGPAYCLTSLEAVSWLNPVLTAMGMTNYGLWNAWELTKMDRTDPTYFHFVEELVGEDKWVGFPKGSPPPLPDVQAAITAVMNSGELQKGIGEFIVQLSDEGVATTILGNGYGIDIAYYQSPITQAPGNPYYDAYYFQTHVRFWWECTTDPELVINKGSAIIKQRLLPQVVILIAVLFAKLLIVGLAIAIPLAVLIGVNNLTHQESSYTKKTTLPDGTVIEESGSESGPPDFWGWVIPIIALVGAVTVAGYFWNLRPRRKE